MSAELPRRQNHFAVGDVVRLRSGGPMMCVNAEANERGYVECVWFMSDETRGEDLFHARTLKIERERREE